MDYFQSEIELAEKVMRGEMGVSTDNDLTHYIERIESLESH